jgi:hypothetical protein
MIKRRSSKRLQVFAGRPIIVEGETSLGRVPVIKWANEWDDDGRDVEAEGAAKKRADGTRQGCSGRPGYETKKRVETKVIGRDRAAVFVRVQENVWMGGKRGEAEQR